MKRILIAMILACGVVAAQQAGVLTLDPKGSNSTISGQATGTWNYQLPAKSGTFALVGDAAPLAMVAGSITLANGGALLPLPAGSRQQCLFFDRTGNSVTVVYGLNAVSIRGVGPVIEYICPQ